MKSRLLKRDGVGKAQPQELGKSFLHETYVAKGFELVPGQGKAGCQNCGPNDNNDVYKLDLNDYGTLKIQKKKTSRGRHFRNPWVWFHMKDGVKLGEVEKDVLNNSISGTRNVTNAQLKISNEFEAWLQFHLDASEH